MLLSITHTLCTVIILKGTSVEGRNFCFYHKLRKERADAD